jgi:hypothetical protein
MARPTKLTAAVQTRLCTAIAAGNSYRVACRGVGVDYVTFWRWLRRDQPAFRKFRKAIRQAEAQAEMRLVALWQAQIPTNWQAARDFLERRFPQRWGRRGRRELAGRHSKPMELRITETEYVRPDDQVKAELRAGRVKVRGSDG